MATPDPERARRPSSILAKTSKIAKRSSIESKNSTQSDLDPYELPRKQSIDTYLYGAGPKKEGGYTSLFHRKLLPPLGFYREVDKYCMLKKKYADDPDKLEAVKEMWQDYEKYQIRKRFRWPPTLFFNKFFWTTGYYPDYQKTRRATQIHRPGDDSSDEELYNNVVGAFLIAAGKDHDDVNLQEFERYMEAKRAKKRMSVVDYGGRKSLREAGRPSTQVRLFGEEADPNTDKGKSDKDKLGKHQAGKELALKGPAGKGGAGTDKDKQKLTSTTEEVETTVEYTVIRNPDKKRKSDSSSKASHKLTEEQAIAVANAAGSSKVLSKRRSITHTVMDATTGKVLSKETKETQ